MSTGSTACGQAVLVETNSPAALASEHQGDGLIRAHLDRICTFKEMRNKSQLNKCPQPSGFFWRTVDGQTQVVPAPCKRYDCPHCGPVKKNILLDKINCGTIRIADDASKPRSWRMIRLLTLTLHKDDPVDIMESYNRFRVSLRDKGYRSIRYFWVKEFTRAGKLHLHILINRFIPQAIVAAAWKDATYGCSYIVHIKMVNFTLRSPAGYMSKYVTKSTHTRMLRRKEHRYGHDQDTDWTAYTQWKPDGTSKWKYEPYEVFTSSMMVSIAGEVGADAGPDQPGVPHRGPGPGPPARPGRSEP